MIQCAFARKKQGHHRQFAAIQRAQFLLCELCGVALTLIFGLGVKAAAAESLSTTYTDINRKLFVGESFSIETTSNFSGGSFVSLGIYPIAVASRDDLNVNITDSDWTGAHKSHKLVFSGEVTSTTSYTIWASYTIAIPNGGHAYQKVPRITITGISRDYSVILDPNGGVCAINRSPVTYELPYGELPIPTRDGYDFIGWFTEKTGGTQVTDSTIFDNRNAIINQSDVTLWAHWNLKPYTINYDANGGIGAPNAQEKIPGTDLILSDTIPSREEQTESFIVTLDANGGTVNPSRVSAMRITSFIFDSWNTQADGNGTSYSPAGIYKADNDITFYALWNKSTEEVAALLPLPARSGYDFKGWAEDRDADGGIIGNYTPNGNVTLYALWGEIPSTYTVSYNANGGEGEPTSQTKIQGTELTLSSSVPTRSSNSAGSYTVTLDPNGGIVDTSSLTAIRTSSYSFENWNTRSDGSGTGYAPGASYTKDEDATLFAMWNESTLTEAVALPTPTQSDCTFRGWAEDRDADSGVVGSYTPAGDVTLYALWEEDTDEYEIIFPTFLTTIGEEAFANSAFTSVLVQESVTSIGSRAFADCKNLKKIIFANGNLDVAGDFVSGCPLDLVIEAPEGSTVANNLELYFRYICPLPEDPDRPEHTPRF